MKKIISVLLVLAMLMGLAIACTPGTANDTAQQPGTATQTETKTEQKAETATQPAQASNTQETAPAASGEKPTAKIGIVATLAADGKFNGYYHQIGYEILKDKLAADNPNVNIEFVIRDMGSDGSELKQRMTELKELGCVAIIGAVADDFGPVCAQWASENKVPVLFTSNYSTEMTITNYSDYIFGTGLNAWGFIKVLAKEAVGNQGKTNYAYVGTDGAGAVDAENILLYEGQKINPDFHCVASYRMSQTESDFSTIIATLMSQAEVPQMTLQQGGNAVISFVMQAAMYDYYSVSSVWSDVIIMPFVVPILNGAGVYSYEGSYGATPLAWWDEDFKDYVAQFRAKGQEVYQTDYQPVEYSMYVYWAGEALEQALVSCVNDGQDFTNGEVLKSALEKISFEEFGSEHHFRDFDHQLTMELFFVDAVDAGEENFHLAMPADVTAVHQAEDYLPSKEEMKEYGETVLGVKDRF